MIGVKYLEYIVICPYRGHFLPLLYALENNEEFCNFGYLDICVRGGDDNTQCNLVFNDKERWGMACNGACELHLRTWEQEAYTGSLCEHLYACYMWNCCFKQIFVESLSEDRLYIIFSKFFTNKIHHTRLKLLKQEMVLY